MGFSVPLADWLRNEIHDISESYLITKAEGLNRLFNHEMIAKLWNEHQNQEADHSPILWSMLMFEMWWQRYMH